jgi:D-alanyl-D-alanine carboxypeptidase
MVIRGDASTFFGEGRPQAAMSWLAAASRALVVLLLVVLIAAVPAEAARKKKRARAHYAPPQAAMVVDLHTGKILYEENADKSRFPASITKVMTLYMLFEQMKKGEFAADTELKVSEWASSRPPSKLGLRPGQTIKVADAMRALVTKSANDVASVVAENIAGSEAAFARMMTHKARMIGMTDTTFVNASGLPDADQKTTARDLITLGRRVLDDFPEEAKIFQTRYFEYGERVFANHNRMLFSYAGMEGMKTGYTHASGFNLLASCRRENKHLIAVVLGGSSSKHRNGRMRTLLDRSWRTAVAMKDPPRRAPVQTHSIARVASRDAMPERNPASRVATDAGGAKPAPAHEIDIDKELVTHADPKEAAEEEEAEAEETGEDEEPKLAAAPKAGAEQGDETVAAQGDVKPEAETKAAAAQQGVNPSPLAVALINEDEPAARPAAPSAPQREEAPVKQEEASLKPPVVKQDQPVLGPYHVQVGSFVDALSARRKLQMVSEEASKLLQGHEELTVEGDVNGKNYFRARYGKFSREDASKTCDKLDGMDIDCLVVKVE